MSREVLLPQQAPEDENGTPGRSQSAGLEQWWSRCTKCHTMPKENDGELDRGLGAWELTLLGIGACIGAGIFVLTGVEARVAGPSVAVSFLLAAGVSVFNGLCYAELASRLPISGAAYLYAYCTFGELAAIILISNQLLDYHIGFATISRSIVSYFAQGLKESGYPIHPCWSGCVPFEAAPWFSISIGAPLIIIMVSIIVAQGAKENALVASVLTSIKILIILVVIVIGATFSSTSNYNPIFPHGLSATFAAAASLNYAYIGYDVIASAAEECRDPQTTIPQSMVATLSVCAFLYVAVCLVLCGMEDSQLIDVGAPVSSAFLARGMTRLAGVIDLAAFVGLTGSTLAGVYGQSRLYFALARDGLAPHVMRKPENCCAWCGAVAAVLAAVLDVSQLGSILNIGVLMAYAVTAASVLAINAQERQQEKWSCARLGFLTLLSGLTWRISKPVASIFIALTAVQASAFFPHQYKTTTGSFQCPSMPWFPLVAFVSNMLLASELHWHAWFRFAVVTFVVMLGHSVASLMGQVDKKARKTGICTTVHASGVDPSVHGLCSKHIAKVQALEAEALASPGNASSANGEQQPR